jgi:hypothetical protein
MVLFLSVSHAVLLQGCKIHVTRHGGSMNNTRTVGSDAVLTMTGNNDDDDKLPSSADFVEHIHWRVTYISYFELNAFKH